MDCTGAVRDVDGDVADLAETVGAFVEAKELRDGGCSLRAEFSGGYVRGERGCCSGVFQEGSVEVDEEELEKHAAWCKYRVINSDT